LMLAGFPVRLVGAVHLPGLSPEHQASFSQAKGAERVKYINHVILEFKDTKTKKWIVADPSSLKPLGVLSDSVVPVSAVLLKAHTRLMGDTSASDYVKGVPAYVMSVDAEISEKDLKEYKTMYQVFGALELVGREGKKATEQIALKKGFYNYLAQKGPKIAEVLTSPVTWIMVSTISLTTFGLGLALGAGFGRITRRA